MGKRELLIIVAFVAIGTLAYRLAVPASSESGSGFSIERLANLWRQNRALALAHARVTTGGRLPVDAGLTIVRLSGFSSVHVIGETREDVAWELAVDGNGPDEEVAQENARASVLQHDDLGGVLALSVRSPGDVRQSGALTLHVPARLGVRVESSRRTTVTGTAAVRLENLVGDAEITNIAGAVEGTHRNGTLTIEDVGDVALTLVTSEATLRRVRGSSTIGARSGATRIESAGGPVAVEINGQTLRVVEPLASVRASGLGGEVHIERPRGSVDVDVRRIRVVITMDRALPVTAFTTDARIELVIPPALPIELDALAESGSIDATALSLTPQRNGDESRLNHVFGTEARVVIRSERSGIVITPGK